MDPFVRIPDDVHEDLLKFFTVFELLDTVSLVSKSWYDVVAASSNCIKKFRLNLRANRKTDFAERIETLKWMSRKGGRGYQHLQLNCLLDERNSEETWKFLQANSASTETINIRSMKIDFDVAKFAMPKLEELKVMFIPREAMNAFLISSANLKTLILRNEFPLCYDGIDYSPSEVTLISIKIFVRRNQKLQELEMQGRPHFFSFFQGDLTPTISFKLKKLTVKAELSAEKILPLYEDNFVTFLTHQAECLEYVYIDSCSARVIQHVFNNMPAVKFIRFDIMLKEPNNFVIRDLNIAPNEKITQLEIPYVALFDDVIQFFELVPNVEEILIGHTIPLLIDYVAKNLPKLKSIVYRYDDCADGCEKYYENLKRDNPDMNQSIVMSICNDFL